MSKRKTTSAVPSVLVVGTEKGEHMSRIMDVMETITYCRVECCLCFKRISIRDTSEGKAAREVYESGWRWVVMKSEAGLCCEECVKNPDGWSS